MKKLILFAFVITALCSTKVIADKLPGEYRHNKAGNTFDDNTKIKLILGDQTYEIQSYSLSYHQTETKPAPNPITGIVGVAQTNSISVVIRTAKINQGLLDWILNPEQELRNGKIVVYDTDSGKVLKTITITGLKITTYSENGNSAANINLIQQTNLAFHFTTINIKLGE